MTTSLSTKRLLIIDDDRSVATTISTIAQKMDFEVRGVYRAADFFTALDEWRPTHVMIDLVMPGCDGVEVIARLAELEPRFRGKVIIMSGLAGRSLSAAKKLAADSGLDFAGVLSKPFSMSALRSLLAQAGNSE